MKDIPMFTTENGAASLILREIPYRGRAHIRLQATQSPEDLLAECVAFCRACGAEEIYATGHPALEKYPFVTAELTLCRSREGLAKADACLFPVTQQTEEVWRRLYNERMAEVPLSAFMDAREGQQMLSAGDGYFVHKDGELLGIGRASGDTVYALAACKAGMGERVVLALAELLTEDRILLNVASANTRALRLYERMGFVTVAQTARWYRIL